MYLNKVQIIGNITKEIELKALPSGIKVANFSVATNRSWKDKDGNKQESVEFHNVVAFGKQAELIQQYLGKGSQIYVEGRLQTRSWEKDEVKQYRTEIMVENFQFGNKTGNETKPMTNDEADKKLEEMSGDINPEDVPF